MPVRTTDPAERRGAAQPEPEEVFPKIADPGRGQSANLFAFLSVIAILGFGIWAALGTLMAPAEGSGTAQPTAAAKSSTSTAAGTALPAAAALPTVAVVVAPTTASAGSAASATPAARPTSTGGGQVHVVGQGDTLYRIAQQYGSTVEAIMAANGFDDRSKILHVGDRLTIP